MATGGRRGGSTGVTGKLGEAFAIRHLERRGYTIIETNYRKRFGEVDIVARQGATIVFVEVKTRRSRIYGTPQEAVDSRKQRQLSRIAEDYLAAHRLESAAARFDVIAVTLGPDGQPVAIDHITNAFDHSK